LPSQNNDEEVIFANSNSHIEIINNFLSISDLDYMLDKICEEMPNIINELNCSIFLIPELVTENTDELVKGDGTTISNSEMEKEFIVLARTSIEGFNKKIGKAYYQKGFGLIGRIFETGQSLQIKDIQNENELNAVDEKLEWTDESFGIEFKFQSKIKRITFLGIPLMKDNTTFGVLSVGYVPTNDSIPDFVHDLLTSITQILSNLIENVQLIRKQNESIERLVKIGSTKEREEVFDYIVQEASILVGAENCELYTLDEYGENIELRSTTGKNMKYLDPKPYERGYGLTGWIFKTGKPLWVGNVQNFEKGRRLSDEDLETISDGKEINEQDRWIKWEDLDGRYKNQIPPAHPYFLGVPIKSDIGEVKGVLRVSAPTSKYSFEKKDMQLLQNFTNNISLILHNERQRQLNEVLIEVGNIYEKKELFNFVVERIPKLVLGRGCSIFLKQSDADKLFLAYTNSHALKKENVIIDLIYEYGEGKTGFVADIKKPLLINYYGTGEIQKKNIRADYKKYDDNSNNIVCYFRDEKGNLVGLIRIVKNDSEDEFTKEEIEKFCNFCEREIIYDDSGLKSLKKTICETGEHGYAQSFLAVPIESKTGGLLGVLRIPRTSEGGRFSDNDLVLVESIVARLTSALEIETNLKILSDINSRINSYASKDEIIETILEAVTDTLGFEFATIQFVNTKNDTIVTEAGRKNSFIEGAIDPKRWVGESNPLNPPKGQKRDIQAYVLMEREKPEVIKRWDYHFNKKLYDKFHHENLVRAFVPIIAYKPTGEPIKIGTLEVGHNISRKDNIDFQELEVIKAVANQVAITIYREQRWSELIDITSHQLRNDITAVKSTIDFMLRKKWGNINNKQQLFLERALRRVNEQDRVIYNLLDIAKIVKEKATVDKEFQDLSFIVNKIVQEFEYDIKLKNINLKLDLSVKGGTKFDKWKIEQILKNLLDNAIKFTPKEGKIIISTFEDEEYVGVKISDTGVGIPEGERSKIFEEFYRGDSSRTGGVRGMGIGLKIAKNYVELHRGKIWVECVENNGSTFFFTIPRVREEDT